MYKDYLALQSFMKIFLPTPTPTPNSLGYVGILQLF